MAGLTADQLDQAAIEGKKKQHNPTGTELSHGFGPGSG
jgi:hypothetical protein